MDPGLVARLDALRPVLKRDWAGRLHQAPAEPPGGGLVTPGMLVLLVDGTIDRLLRRLGGAPAGRRVRPTRFNSTRTGCHCGLHLLLTYYLAGARALRETLPADLGPARGEVLHCFNQLAREEMTARCDACNHRGGALCLLRPDGISPAPAGNPVEWRTR